MTLIKIRHFRHGDTIVKVVRETPKAILLAGAASEAWFPKAAIDSDNWVADWFPLKLEHFFLFDAPFPGDIEPENVEEDYYPGEWNGGWGEDYAMMRNER